MNEGQGNLTNGGDAVTVRHLADIPHEELQLLGAALQSMGANESAGEALHLRVFTGGRQWIVETGVGQLVVDIEDVSSTHAQDTFFQLSERVFRFADSFGDDTVSLLTGDERTVIAYASGANAAIDLIPWSGPELTPWSFIPSASAVVSMRRLQLLLSAAGCVPSGLHDETYPRPPMWLHLGEGKLGLYIDWTDFLPSRATYRMRTISHEGRQTVAIPHQVIEALLRPAPQLPHDHDEPTCTITIGKVPGEQCDSEAIMLAVDGWRVILWIAQPVRQRWASRVNRVLAADGVEVAATDGVAWAIAGNFDVRVTLHHGHPDVARVTSVLLRAAGESVDLFRELGYLNAASNHIRYWLDDGEVRSAVDVQCTELARLPDIVRQVAAAAAKYAPMLAVLSTTD